MTMSKMDPATTMTPKQKYECGLDIEEMGGNIILAGIPYLI